MPRKASGQRTPNDAGQPWQRPVDVLVGRFEGLAVEEAQDEKGRDGRGGGERNAPPPRRGQPAIGKDERDRDQHREEQRPGRLVPQHRPFGPGQRAGLLLHGVRRVGLRDAEGRQHETRSRAAASRSDDLVAAPPPAARPRTRRAPQRPRAPTATQALRASPRARSAPSRAAPNATASRRENPGPRGGPAHGTIVSRRRPDRNSAAT